MAACLDVFCLMTYNAEIHIQKPQPASDRALVGKNHKTLFLFFFRKKEYNIPPPTFTSECVQPITTDL